MGKKLCFWYDVFDLMWYIKNFYYRLIYRYFKMYKEIVFYYIYLIFNWYND